MTSVGADFPRQVERVRGLIDWYEGLPDGAGAFGAAIMRAQLAHALVAWESGDVVQVLAAYELLRSWEA